jgi:ribonuclease HI
MTVKAGAGGEAFLQSAFHAELLGCIAGLKEAARMGLSIVCLETDASMVKSVIEGDEYHLSALRGIITELKLVLLSEFRSWKTCSVLESVIKLPIH